MPLFPLPFVPVLQSLRTHGLSACFGVCLFAAQIGMIGSANGQSVQAGEDGGQVCVGKTEGSASQAAPTEKDPATRRSDHAGRAETHQAVPHRVEAVHLPNLVRLTGRIYCGGTPEGIEGFETLGELGIRTVISVDGARPQLAAARRQGMRYVHLPIGYDKLVRSRSMELAKALRDLPGPIYVHCHHGRHRAPVAACVASLHLGILGQPEAERVLKLAGTGKRFKGLRRSVAEADLVDDVDLDSLVVRFEESAAVPTLARAMVDLDRQFQSLQDARSGMGPKALEEEALLVEEAFHEIGRLRPSRERGEDFLERLARARGLTQRLGAASDSKASGRVLQQLKESCQSCHAAYRDR